MMTLFEEPEGSHKARLVRPNPPIPATVHYSRRNDDVTHRSKALL